jgi:hypothetical protein
MFRHRTCVSFLEMLTYTSVNFLTRSCTEVSSLSLARNEIPSTIRNEPNREKNKIFKPHGTKTYLTLKFIKTLNVYAQGGTTCMAGGTNVPPIVLKFTLKLCKFINLSPKIIFLSPLEMFLYILTPFSF